MPHYQLEWQEKKQKGGTKIVINCAKDIIVHRAEKNPDKIAEKDAEKIFEGLPQSSAVLKQFSATFDKKIVIKEFAKP